MRTKYCFSYMFPVSDIYTKTFVHIITHLRCNVWHVTQCDCWHPIRIFKRTTVRMMWIFCKILHNYGVVPKGLLTFLGSLYKEVTKTTPGTLVYYFQRQTARKKKSLKKHCVLNLEYRILSQEPSFCILIMSHSM